MSVVAKICRRLSPKTFAISAIGLTVILCVYYASYTTDVGQRGGGASESQAKDDELRRPQQPEHLRSMVGGGDHKNQHDNFEICPKLMAAEADVNTVDVFKDFEFQVSVLLNSIMYLI